MMRFGSLALIAVALAGAQDGVQFRPIDLTLTEATNFSAAVSPNRRWIAVDVLGSLWVLPATGGEAQRLTSDTMEVSRPSWSPDNDSIAFAGFEDDVWHIYTVRRDGSDLRTRTTGLFDDRDPAWSHDGTRIAFSSDRFGGIQTIWTVGVADGSLVRVTTGSGVEPSWSPSDRDLIFARSVIPPPRNGAAFGLWAINADGRERLIIDTKDKGAPAFPSWSADGRQLAYELGGQLMVDGRALTTDEDVFLQRPQWLPAGEILYTADGHIKKMSVIDGRTTTVPFSASLSLKRPSHAASHRLLEPAEPQPLRGLVSSVVSPDGKFVAFVALGDLWVMPIGEAPARVTNDPFIERDPAWSPDSARLAFSSDRDGSQNLWVLDLANGAVTQLTHEKAAVTGAAWSPDGTRIAYRVGGTQFSVVRLAGTIIPFESEPHSFPSAFDLGRPTWASDSRSVALGTLFPYAGLAGNGLNQLIIHTFDPRGDTSVLLFPEHSAGNRESGGPVWSPDGTQMAFTTEGKLWIVGVNFGGAPTEPARIIADSAPESPSWEADGRRLTYQTPDGLRRVSVDGGVPEVLPLDLTWAPSEPPARVVIHAGHLFNGVADASTVAQDIVVEHGVITEVSAHDDSRHVGAVIDAPDETVMAGLIEMRAPQEAAMSTTIALDLLASGITSVRVPAIDPYAGLEQREAVGNGRRLGPRVFMGGSPVDGRRVREAGGISVMSQNDLDQALGAATRLGVDFIAARGRLGRKFHRQIPEYAHAHGVPAATAEWLPGLLFGYDVLEQIPRRVYGDVIDAAGKLGVTIPSAIGVPVGARVDSPTAQRIAQLKRIHNAGGRIVAASSPFRLGLHDELEHLGRGGFTPFEALRAATADAAAALGVDDVIGTVEPGKLADLIFVDGDPLSDLRAAREVRRVMLAGRLYNAQQLRKSAER